MRLLHTTNYSLEVFFDSQVPRYATLSHCWGEGEVSLQSFTAEVAKWDDAVKFEKIYEERRYSHPGYWKIIRCCQLAKQNDFTWVWIDTCCIDKSSSAELSEAINSMYRIYEESGCCYAYLADVESVPKANADKPENSFSAEAPKDLVASRWFTRGWTLQELLAPSKLLFYSATWELVGSRSTLASEISKATNISSIYLNYDRAEALEAFLKDWGHGQSPNETEPTDFRNASIATRMSWLSYRQTSRVEDMAYCMLGIFDVNMPLLYGEGQKAFMRLQLEIIKKFDDESIFAWVSRSRTLSSISNSNRPLQASRPRTITIRIGGGVGMLADWPDKFADSGDIWIDRGGKIDSDRLPYSMTNRGLEFKTNMNFWSNSSDWQEGTIIDIGLNCFRGPRQTPSCVNVTLRRQGRSWWRVEDEAFKETRWQESNVRRFGSMPSDASPMTVTLFIRQEGL